MPLDTDTVIEAERRNRGDFPNEISISKIKELKLYDSLRKDKPLFFYEELDKYEYHIYDRSGTSPYTGKPLASLTRDVAQEIESYVNAQERLEIEKDQRIRADTAANIAAKEKENHAAIVASIRRLYSCDTKKYDSAISLQPSDSDITVFFLRTLKNKIRSRNISTDFFSDDFYASQSYSELKAGDIEVFQEAGVFKCTDAIIFGELNADFSDNGTIVSAKLELRLKRITETRPKTGSVVYSEIAPGFNQEQALQEVIDKMLDEHLSDIFY